MVSLGDDAYVKLLTADEIIVSGNVTAQHKKFGPEFNQGEIHHNGSVFYLKWSAVHQCVSVDTTNGAATATWNIAADHNLLVGDVVHIGRILNVATVNGIPSSEFTGTHVLTVVTTRSFTYVTTTNANLTGNSTAVTPQMRIDRYKYIDLATHATTWYNSTVVPVTSTHTNVEPFYF